LLTRLKLLRLSYNQLSTLPPMLGQLVNLEALHINNNRVRPGHAALRWCADVCLVWAQITAVPPMFGLMRKLTTLTLQENPLESPAKAIVDKGTKAVMEFLRAQLSNPSQLHNRVKVCIVGQENVGKTTLAEAIRREKWSDKEVCLCAFASPVGRSRSLYLLRSRMSMCGAWQQMVWTPKCVDRVRSVYACSLTAPVRVSADRQHQAAVRHWGCHEGF
jgi:hypothetical protein